MYRESFKSKLANARKRTGLTQRDVAAETGIPQSTLANYETGRTEPDIENLGILGDFYNVDLNWLIGTKYIPSITPPEAEGGHKVPQEKNK